MDDCKVTMADVERFGRFIIELTGIFTVDEEGYVINPIVDDMDDDRPVLIKFGSSYKRPMILKEKIKDTEAAIINPLNENTAESQEQKWFYTVLNSGLVARFINLAGFLSDVVEQSNAGTADEMNLPHSTISFVSKHKDFDKKTYEHFRLIAKDHTEFMRVWYNRKTKESRFRCSVYNSDTHGVFPQVPAKSWKAIISFISDVLGVSKDIELANSQIEERFFVHSDLLTVPRVESTLTVYSRIYSRINNYLEMVIIDNPYFVVDVAELDNHIIKLPEYYKRASWFSSGTFTSAQSKSGIKTIERSGQPAPGSGIPSNPMLSGNRGLYSPVMVEDSSNIPSNPRRVRQGFGDIEYANSGSTFAHQGIQYAQRPAQPMGPTFNTGFGGGGFNQPSSGIPIGNMGMPQQTGISINPQLNQGMSNIGMGGFSMN